MGKQRQQADPVYKTHEAYYKKLSQLCDILVVENAPEYAQTVIEAELGPTWSVRSEVIDPRVFGIGAARSRRYAICWKTEAATWRSDVKMSEVIDLLTSSVATKAGSFYWQTLPKSTLTNAQVHGFQMVSN